MRNVVPPTRHVTQPRPAQERGKAKLEWATVDGVIFHAAQFVGVDPSDRPEGRCQCCEEAIVWKAGDVVLPHVAHRANSTCAATNPETAEHMNAKAKIAHALTCENVLAIASKCSAGHPSEMPWAVAPWAYAQPEYRLGTRRPDVALLDASRDGLAAIEVLHTHAVDKVKAADFAAAGLPWVEVLSSVALEWDEKRPLPIVAADAVTRAGFDAACRQCEEKREWRAVDRLRVAAEKERVQRAFVDTLAFAALQHGIAALEKRSDVLCISTVGFDRWDDGDKIPLVGAMVMHEGAKPRGARVPDFGGGHDWLALDFALAWLEQSAPGRGALIYVDDEGILKQNLPERHWGWEVSDIMERVRAAMSRTGSVLVSNGRASKLTAYWDTDAAHHWRYKIEEFLLEERVQHPTDTDHVPRRWLSWWGPWAAPLDGGPL